MDNEYNLTQQVGRLTGELQKVELAIQQTAAKRELIQTALQDAQTRLAQLPLLREENPPELEAARRALAANNAALIRQRAADLERCLAPLGVRSKAAAQAADTARAAGDIAEAEKQEAEQRRIIAIRNTWYYLGVDLGKRAEELEQRAGERKDAEDRRRRDRQEARALEEAQERKRTAKQETKELLKERKES